MPRGSNVQPRFHLLSVDLLSSSINAAIMHILKNYSKINFFVIIISVCFV